ncbi:MAG: hypothetical protein EZS28_029286 [Streblomastix strix]|uniref:Uncharacterized protein n=1 Tax=Streblomastix strix TaxID=222440 RepID=A0A5J4UXW0_9EUKA|nr:MAG: hypothetical protein EZS28_029286 [Streblomastix strix]
MLLLVLNPVNVARLGNAHILIRYSGAVNGRLQQNQNSRLRHDQDALFQLILAVTVVIIQFLTDIVTDLTSQTRFFNPKGVSSSARITVIKSDIHSIYLILLINSYGWIAKRVQVNRKPGETRMSLSDELPLRAEIARMENSPKSQGADRELALIKIYKINE